MNHYPIAYATRRISFLRNLSCLQIKVEGSRRLLHKSAAEDDFEELGVPLESEPAITRPVKLLTEKSDIYQDSRVKHLLKFNISKGNRNLKPDKLTPTNEEDDSVSSNFRRSCSITVENVPAAIKLHQLKAALNIFGKILNTSTAQSLKALGCCHVEFESEAASQKALTIGGMYIDKFYLPINPLHGHDTIAVKISNICVETPDSDILAMCTSCGPLERVVRTQNTVEAFFNVKNISDTQSILQRLNYVIMDDSQCSAELQSVDYVSRVEKNTSDAQSEEILKLNKHIEDLKREMALKKMLFEDFKYLHDCIMHLEGYGAAYGCISQNDGVILSDD